MTGSRPAHWGEYAGNVMRLKISSFAIGLIIVFTPQLAKAKNLSLCSQAYSIRASVIDKYGYKAPGLNICRLAMPGGKHANNNQKARYLRAIKALNAKAPYLLSVRAGFPRLKPAGTKSVIYKPIGLAACIAYAEGRNNPRAINGQYTGTAQWSYEAWHRHGGGRYASTPLGASLQEQYLVLSNGLLHWGCRDFCPFDRCG